MNRGHDILAMLHCRYPLPAIETLLDGNFRPGTLGARTTELRDLSIQVGIEPPPPARWRGNPVLRHVQLRGLRRIDPRMQSLPGAAFPGRSFPGPCANRRLVPRFAQAEQQPGG